MTIMRWQPARRILEPDAMARVDAAAIQAGVPGAALMENAGRAVAAAIRRRWPEGDRAAILVGGGNNGGDGLVAARHLVESGWKVVLLTFVDPGRLDGDAGLQWSVVEPMGLPVERIETVDEAREAVERHSDATVVVDALLGTGLSGEVREPMASGIEAFAGGPPVVAVDVPSGLDGRTGAIHGVAPRAALTVTFGYPQPGHFVAEGPERVGELVVVPLGYPPSALAADDTEPLGWIAIEEAREALPPRRHDAHKGTAGRLLVVAGSERYAGAVVLTAVAALRSGAGMCTVATPEPAAERVLASLPEAIVRAMPADDEGAFSAEAAGAVAELAADADAVAIGPGLDTARGVRAVVEAALASGVPAVVDADGLNVLADDPDPIRRDAPTVITPHPGELGRWLDRPAGEIDADRIAAAREARDRWGAIVVLKGSPTVVAGPGAAVLNLTGNPGLATGGSGDVLTGLVGALLAGGVDAPRAARVGPLLHGLAADRVAFDRGERGLAPSDLHAALPLVVREVTAGRGDALLERIEHRYARLLAARGRA